MTNNPRQVKKISDKLLLTWHKQIDGKASLGGVHCSRKDISCVYLVQTGF